MRSEKQARKWFGVFFRTGFQETPRMDLPGKWLTGLCQSLSSQETEIITASLKRELNMRIRLLWRIVNYINWKGITKPHRDTMEGASRGSSDLTHTWEDTSERTFRELKIRPENREGTLVCWSCFCNCYQNSKMEITPVFLKELLLLGWRSNSKGVGRYCLRIQTSNEETNKA